MPRIHILPDQVADRIAAGEVVERPSSIVKELLENAIDATATAITVVIEDGGKRLIRVEDDGEGMDAEDAAIAFERHATSKLSSDGDLDSIATLGFRGEALPSIAAVSNVRLVTARRGAAEGCRIDVKGGLKSPPQFVGAPAGTVVEVTDLFYNIPARRKFLKTASTELAHAVTVVSQHALAHPEIHFRVLHGGREVLAAPRAVSLEERIVQVYGEEWAADGVPVALSEGGFRIRGIVSRPHASRGTRSAQEWFVGGRPVRSPSLNHALYEAYGPLLAHGRHPSFVLFADGPPGSVDINVHPTKREVRFRDPQLWYTLTKRAVEGLWRAEEVSLSEARVLAAGEAESSVVFSRTPESARFGLAESDAYADRVREAAARYAAGAAPAAVERPFVPRPAAPPRRPSGPIRILGQIKNTFIVAEIGDAMQIIDQHTAHERVLFDRLWERVDRSRSPVQPLLFPMPLDLKRDHALLLEEHRDVLEKIGLEFDGFGGDTVVVRAVPQLVAGSDIAALVQEIVDDLVAEVPAGGVRGRTERLVATMACHAAVRANDILEHKEMVALIEDLYRTPMPWSCPHGRPVILAFSHTDLDRMFHRR